MKILIIAVSAAVAIVFSLAVTPYVAPSASYKETTERILSERFGVPVSIERMRIHLLPHPYFTIDNIALTSPEAPFKHTPIMRVKSASGSLALWGALRKRAITDIILDGFEINYIKDTSGLTNVDRLLALQANEGTRAPTDGWKLSIDSIVASRGRIVVHDYAKNTTSEVRIAKYTATGLSAGHSIMGTMYVNAAIFGSSEPNFEIAGQFALERITGALHARRCKARILGMDATLDATASLRTQPISFEVHAVTPDATRKELGILFPSLDSSLPAGISWLGPASLDLYLKGTKEQTTIRFQGEFSRSTIRVGNLLDKPPGRALKIGFAGINGPAHLIIEAFNARLGESSSQSLIQLSGSILHGPDHRAQLVIQSNAFKLDELKTSMPMLAVFESAELPSAFISLQGSLDNPAHRLMSGRFTAGKARIMGVDLGNLTIDFHRKDGTIDLPYIKATAFDGKLSANGKIALEGTPRYDIHAVIDECNLAKIRALSGALAGKGSLVMEVTSQGTDARNMTSGMKAQGTLVSMDASIPTLLIGKNLMGLSTWRFLESNVADVALSGDAMLKLESADSAARDLHASFVLSGGSVTVSDFRFINPNYTLWLLGAINARGSIDASGSVWLNKKATSELLPKATVRRTVTNRKGDLQIPFTLKGMGSGLIARIAQDGFKDVLKGNASPTPTVAAIGKERAPEVAKEEKKEIVKKTVKRKPKTKKRTKRPAKKSSTRIPPSQTDDVLKVLIR